jgi:hypothetical protein
MAEKLFYYLLALTLAGSFSLVYNMILTELRNRRERRERESLQAAQVERRQVAEREPQPQTTIQERGYDSPQVFYDDALQLIQQLQREINERVRELEKEL